MLVTEKTEASRLRWVVGEGAVSRSPEALISSCSKHPELTSFSPLHALVLAVLVLGTSFHLPKTQTPLHLSRTTSNATSPVMLSVAPTFQIERIPLPQSPRAPASTGQMLFLAHLPITEANGECPEDGDRILYLPVFAAPGTQVVRKCWLNGNIKMVGDCSTR